MARLLSKEEELQFGKLLCENSRFTPNMQSTAQNFVGVYGMQDGTYLVGLEVAKCLSPLSAAHIHDCFATLIHGEHARLNFPNLSSQGPVTGQEQLLKMTEEIHRLNQSLTQTSMILEQIATHLGVAGAPQNATNAASPANAVQGVPWSATTVARALMNRPPA